MAVFDTSHSQTTETLTGALPEFNLPSIEFPQVALPDTLNSLAAFAAQIQTIIAAAFTHPFWAIAAVIVSIGLLQLVADLVKRILKAGLTLILTLPMGLSQWIWKRATTASAPEVNEKARITQLFNRLEALSTEQDQAVAELKKLLQSSAIIHTADGNKPVIDDTKQSSLPASSASPSLQSSAESPRS